METIFVNKYMVLWSNLLFQNSSESNNISFSKVNQIYSKNFLKISVVIISSFLFLFWCMSSWKPNNLQTLKQKSNIKSTILTRECHFFFMSWIKYWISITILFCNKKMKKKMKIRAPIYDSFESYKTTWIKQ